MHIPLHFCMHKIQKTIMAVRGYFWASLNSFKYLTEIPCHKLTNTNRLNFYLFTSTVWGWMTVEVTVQFHSSAGQLTAR